MLISFSLQLLWIPYHIAAAPVSRQQASQVALNFYIVEAGLSHRQMPGVVLLEAMVSGSDTLSFVFSVGKGFVIVAGNDLVRPVLGYSIHGSYDPAAKPPAFDYLMGLHREFIALASEARIQQSAEARAAWDELLAHPVGSGPADNGGVIIASAWGEGCNYNMNFPLDSAGPCGKTYTGSIAVAMGQVMRYHGHPRRGSDTISYLSNYGSKYINFEDHTYDWSNMPLVWAPGNTEIPKLLYHTALSVEADFSTSVYNINCLNIGMSDVRNALVTHFGYSKDMQDIYSYSMSDSLWLDTLRKELDTGRPVIFSGQPKTGCNRVFVVDGYKNQVFFHINWGWNGLFDGFYLLDQLYIQAINYDFSNNQQALIGIEPLVKELNGNYYYGHTYTKVFPSVPLALKRLNGTVIDTVQADQAGYFVFPDVSDGTFRIEPRVLPAWGGSNAADALLILNYFIGIYSLNGTKFDAADVDGSGYVNATDALLIARRFVGYDTNFPVPDWIFHNDTVKVEGADKTVSVRAVCRGDVDGSYNP